MSNAVLTPAGEFRQAVMPLVRLLVKHRHHMTLQDILHVGDAIIGVCLVLREMEESRKPSREAQSEGPQIDIRAAQRFVGTGP